MILGISGFSSCKLLRCSWNLTDVCLCVVKKLSDHIMQIRSYGCRFMFTYATMGNGSPPIVVHLHLLPCLNAGKNCPVIVLPCDC